MARSSDTVHYEAIEPHNFAKVWPLIQAVVRPGDTYALDTDLSFAQGLELFCETAECAYMAMQGELVLGCFYLKQNQAGGGAHVCNCGYMVSVAARGRGIARAMREYSQEIALERGYRAMQFNFVVATNEVAIALWQNLGYEIVGRLPAAFRHPQVGYVDSLVMHKQLHGDD